MSDPEYQLMYRSAGGEWVSLPIAEGNLRIGRGAGSDLQLPGRLVSREHAEIRRRGERLWLVDLGSSNGTRKDGDLLQEGIPLPFLPGQSVTIGEYTLKLVRLEPDETQTAVTAETNVPESARSTARITQTIPSAGLAGVISGEGHVFVSYSRQDKELVYPLARKLEEAGVKVWIDKQAIKAGETWRGQIVQAIAEADSFLILLSPSSCASDNVRKELDLAIDAGILVLPVVLLPVQVTAALMYQLIGIQRINLFSELEAGFNQLIAGIRERQAYLAVNPRQRPRMLQAEVILPSQLFDEFYQDKQQRLLHFLGQATGASPGSFSIAAVAPGSVRVTVNLPAEVGYELKAQALNGHPALVEAGISLLRLVGDQQFIPIGGIFPPPGGGEAGQPPEPPPTSNPPASMPGGGLMKILLITAGVVGLAIVALLALPRRAPPAIQTSPPVLIVDTPTRTPSPNITQAGSPSQTTAPVISSTVMPSRTVTPARMETGTPTETVFVCEPYLVVTTQTHCREGPGTVYDIVTSLLAGEQQVSIEGRNDDPSVRWWWVQLPSSPANCWISDSNVQTFGAPECRPIIAAPPTPTPIPTDTPTPIITDTPTPSPTVTPSLTYSPPGTPQPISPVDDEWFDCSLNSTVDLVWTEPSSASGIDYYEWVVEIYDSSGGSSEFDSGSTSATTATVDISCSANFRWYVRAVDNSGVAGAYSDYAYYTTEFSSVP